MRHEKFNSPKWIGMRFGRFVVTGAVHGYTGGESKWLWCVKCDCGNEKVVIPNNVIRGKSLSCGCYRDQIAKGPRTHGERRTRLYTVWAGIVNRCNPSNKHTGYGGRGILLCEEWKNYENFAEWAKENGYNDDLTIERIDVNGNYCPENCTWIPLKKQARNRRTTHWVEYNGRRMSLAEACEIAGLPYQLVSQRIAKCHWSVEEALSIPNGACSNIKDYRKMTQ